MEISKKVLSGDSAFFHPNGFWVAEILDVESGNLVFSGMGETRDDAESNAKAASYSKEVLDELINAEMVIRVTADALKKEGMYNVAELLYEKLPNIQDIIKIATT